MSRIKIIISFFMLLAASNPCLRAQIITLNTPEIIRVTVDTATGLAGIEWKASTSPDIEKYELYYDSTILGQQGWRIAGTVDGDTRQFYFAGLDSGLEDWTLTVLAYDTTGNRSNFTDSHSTVHLSTSYDSCTLTMELEWTPYLGWDELVRYEVYVLADGGPFSKLKDIHRDTLNYEHPNIEVNHQYCYLVRAISPTTHSFSNITCRNVSHPLQPAWIDAESASAVGGDQVELRFAIDPSCEVRNFQLFKAAGPGKPFTEGEIFREVEDSLVHLDPVISTGKRYQYKLKSLDVCDNPVVESNICGNIILAARSVGLQGFLNWSPYVEYEAGVYRYLVYRDISQTGPILAGGVFAPDTMYRDDLSFLSGQEIEDEICYYVEAEENGSYIRGRQGFSRSNQACVSVVPEIIMANALIPNSSAEKNREIKPELTFIPAYYLFQVFDRWGSKVFETNAFDEAWDGSINRGSKAPEGVYVYFIKLTTSSGIEVVKKGDITVFYR